MHECSLVMKKIKKNLNPAIFPTFWEICFFVNIKKKSFEDEVEIILFWILYEIWLSLFFKSAAKKLLNLLNNIVIQDTNLTTSKNIWPYPQKCHGMLSCCMFELRISLLLSNACFAKILSYKSCKFNSIYYWTEITINLACCMWADEPQPSPIIAQCNMLVFLKAKTSFWNIFHNVIRD